MASKQSTVDFIVRQAAAAGAVRARKMFGEYAVYCDEKLVALVADDQLFLKPTAAGKALLGPCPEASPYPGAKPCLVIADEKWADPVWMAKLVSLTAAELPPPQPKAAAGAKTRPAPRAKQKKTATRPRSS